MRLTVYGFRRAAPCPLPGTCGGRTTSAQYLGARVGGCRTIWSTGPLGRVVVRPDTLDEQQVALDVIGTQAQDGPVRGRVVPGTGFGKAGEFDQHHAAGPRTLYDFGRRAVDDEAACEGVEGRLDALQVLDDVGVIAAAAERT